MTAEQKNTKKIETLMKKPTDPKSSKNHTIPQDGYGYFTKTSEHETDDDGVIKTVTVRSKSADVRDL